MSAKDHRELARRLGIVTLVVATWMSFGWMFARDANVYLFLGIPITIAFQGMVAREGIKQLWVFEGAPTRARLSVVLLGSFLALVPLQALVAAEEFTPPVSHRAWYIISAIGLIVAA
jgi:hypothetical protein